MSESVSTVVEARVARSEEKTLFFRSGELPGVEVRSVENSSRLWRYFSAGFEFLGPETWRGEVVARSGREELAPGMLFCSYPGEVYSTPRVHEPGSLNALVIDPEVLAASFAEHGVSLAKVELRRVVRMSPALQGKLSEVFEGFREGACAEQHRARLNGFIAVLVNELVDRELGSTRSAAGAVSPAERVREYLELDPSARTDLRALSHRTGLSRFQVLRAFRSSFGLPPHAYKLCVRIGLAQRALRRGSAPAEVAAEYGFVDQSHFTRHFKRLIGVTPLEYAFARSRQRRTRGAQAA